MSDPERIARLLARHIDIPGYPKPTAKILREPPPEIQAAHWIWTGTFRPKNPSDAFDRYRINLIRLPRPTTVINGGKERHPVKPLMCLQVPGTEEPDRIHQRCTDKRCVNPSHWSANRACEALRKRFP